VVWDDSNAATGERGDRMSIPDYMDEIVTPVCRKYCQTYTSLLKALELVLPLADQAHTNCEAEGYVDSNKVYRNVTSFVFDEEHAVLDKAEQAIMAIWAEQAIKAEQAKAKGTVTG
jgi:hypothetical protein